MAKGQRLKSEQIVTLWRQIDVLTANGKTSAQACKEVGIVEQCYYRLRKICGGRRLTRLRSSKRLKKRKYPPKEARSRPIATKSHAQGSY
jgi:hypothetical protein